jgi:hypothetical protein
MILTGYDSPASATADAATLIRSLASAIPQGQ